MGRIQKKSDRGPGRLNARGLSLSPKLSAGVRRAKPATARMPPLAALREFAPAGANKIRSLFRRRVRRKSTLRAELGPDLPSQKSGGATFLTHRGPGRLNARGFLALMARSAGFPRWLPSPCPGRSGWSRGRGDRRPAPPVPDRSDPGRRTRIPGPPPVGRGAETPAPSLRPGAPPPQPGRRLPQPGIPSRARPRQSPPAAGR